MNFRFITISDAAVLAIPRLIIAGTIQFRGSLGIIVVARCRIVVDEFVTVNDSESTAAAHYRYNVKLL